MKESVLYYFQAVPTLAYWLSLLVIGYVIVCLIKQRFTVTFPTGLKGNIPFYLLLSFAISVAVLGLLSIVMYLFNLPSILYTILYVILLIASLVWSITTLRLYLAKKRQFVYGGWGFYSLITVIIAVFALLGIDYAASTVFGAQFAEGSDSYVHVAKILTLSEYGFSLDDGFMEGVAETRYHYNGVYPLYIPLIHLVGLIPADAWNLSTGFFRLMQWIAIAALAYFVAKRYLGSSTRSAWLFTCLSVIVGVAIFSTSSGMHVAMYPNKIETLWLVVLAVGLLLSFEGYRKLGIGLAICASLLITLTHPTYALMAALFVGILAVLLLAHRAIRYRYFSRNILYYLGGLCLILMLSPLITIMFPDRMTDASFDYGDFTTVEVAGVSILPIHIPQTLYAAVLAAVSLLGYAFLLYKIFIKKRYTSFIICLLLPLFIYLLVHNPVFMAAVQGNLPLWLVARFGAMNVLKLIALPLGIYALIHIFVHYVKSARIRQIAAILGIVLLAVWFGYGAKNAYATLYAATKGIDHGYLEFIHRTNESLGGVFPKGSVVVANVGDSYFLPAVLPIKVIAIHEAHATPEADSEDRRICQEALVASSYNESLLNTVDADYVIVPKWDSKYKTDREMLDTNDAFVLAKETGDYVVYEVKSSRLDSALKYGACYRYQIDELN